MQKIYSGHMTVINNAYDEQRPSTVFGPASLDNNTWHVR